VVIIRPARLDDRESLCRLYHAFHEFHVFGVPGRLVGLGEPPDDCEGTELYRTLGEIIEDDGAALFVAEAADGLLGFAEVYVREDAPAPLRQSYRYGLLQSLMVEEGVRQQGIGTRLLEAAEGWARDHGAREMRVETWEFAGGPRPFYERRHYRTLRRTWVREI
jgi:GNAT superfamily N-acetyltransferase